MEERANGTQRARKGIATLKRRSEFLRIRKGARWATSAFVLEAKERGDKDGSRGIERPRFGFTVTKQTGKAVERNRIRRRLKAAVRDVQMDHARRDFDYVLIARRAALDAPFASLVASLASALERVHRPRPSRPRGPGARK